MPRDTFPMQELQDAIDDADFENENTVHLPIMAAKAIRRMVIMMDPGAAGRIRRAAHWIRRVYEYNSVGGYAHIVLDDGNIEDEHIEFCVAAVKEDQRRVSYGELYVTNNCLSELTCMTEPERSIAIELYEEQEAAARVGA